MIFVTFLKRQILLNFFKGIYLFLLQKFIWKKLTWFQIISLFLTLARKFKFKKKTCNLFIFTYSNKII